MKKLFLTLTLGVAAFAANSQGVLEYDWHGDSGIFQGSFQVHEGVTDFRTDPTYWQTFTVISSQFPTLTNSWSIGGGPTSLPMFNGISSGTGVEYYAETSTKGQLIVRMQSGADGYGAVHATDYSIYLEPVPKSARIG